MKKIVILLLTLTVMGAIHAQSTEKKHEVNAGFGLAGSSTIINSFSDILASSLDGDGYSKDNVKWSGNFRLGYRYLLSPRIAIGATYTFSKSSGDVLLLENRIGSLKHSYHTIAGELDYKYINNSYLALYSSIGLGMTRYNETYKPSVGSKEKNNHSHFDFQLTPIGIRIGDSVGAFAEAGFGYKGIINAGMFVRF